MVFGVYGVDKVSADGVRSPMLLSRKVLRPRAFAMDRFPILDVNKAQCWPWVRCLHLNDLDGPHRA
jgi:hypothetical protein